MEKLQEPFMIHTNIFLVPTLFLFFYDAAETDKYQHTTYSVFLQTLQKM